ncbi:MAG: nitrate reductase [Verrucomicrobia bacterium]|nr:nitrate reductase [Verrucomicrobiota bacterium]
METTVKTICPYCGVGCGLAVKVRDGRIVQVKGDDDHPANFGSLCTKGATIDQIVRTPNRLAFAHVRDAHTREFKRVDLDSALTHCAEEFERIICEHGPAATAFYLSGQLTTEAQYVFNKLAKGALGTNNVDSNSRLCMASAVSAYQMALGADAPPTCYDDIEASDCFLILGANMAECHPVLWQRIKRRAGRGRAKIIVVDPRRTPTAEGAHLHLAPRPGTDVALLNAILHVMIAQGWINERFIRDHTAGYEQLRELVEAWSPFRASKVTGIEERLIHRAAFWFGMSAEALSFWAMGANQSTQGVGKNLAIINLHLATGKIGRPGSGPFSLTGQPNAMGGRAVGYINGGLPGHRTLTNARHREQVARIWGVPSSRIRPTPGLDAVRLFEAIELGDVRALWVVGCNPLATMPNSHQVRRALEKLELLIVQDCYHPTETSPFAHVLLPAAMNLEVEGTMINSERRVSLLQPCVPPPGDARPDWELGTRFAALMGFEESFSYNSAQDVFEEFKLCTNGVFELEMCGINYRRLKHHPLQWPCPTSHSPGIARRYRRKIFATSDGRARFHAVNFEPPADAITPEYPLALITGRLAHQWHSRTKTAHVAKLNKLNPGPFVAAHPGDATRLGLADGAPVRLVSRRGFVRTTLKVDDAVAAGTLFMPFHWGVNAITNPEADRVSREPELKFTAARLEADAAGSHS